MYKMRIYDRRKWICEFFQIALELTPACQQTDKQGELRAVRDDLLRDPELTEYVFAVPGDTMIDLVIPETQLTSIFGKTLEMTRQEYPGAVLMTLDAYCESKAAVQDTAVTWSEVSEEKYFDMLEVLPPAFQRGGAFLVGEPQDHHAVTGRPRFDAFKAVGKKYFTASRPMTVKEFKESLK